MARSVWSALGFRALSFMFPLGAFVTRTAECVLPKERPRESPPQFCYGCVKLLWNFSDDLLQEGVSGVTEANSCSLSKLRKDPVGGDLPRPVYSLSFSA